MAQTIPGGIYFDSNGKTYHDAEGKPVTDTEKLGELEKLNRERTEQARKQEEALRQMQIAALQPVATAQAMALEAARQQMQVNRQPVTQTDERRDSAFTISEKQAPQLDGRTKKA